MEAVTDKKLENNYLSLYIDVLQLTIFSVICLQKLE